MGTSDKQEEQVSSLVMLKWGIDKLKAAGFCSEKLPGQSCSGVDINDRFCKSFGVELQGLRN